MLCPPRSRVVVSHHVGVAGVLAWPGLVLFFVVDVGVVESHVGVMTMVLSFYSCSLSASCSVASCRVVMMFVVIIIMFIMWFIMVLINTLFIMSCHQSSSSSVMFIITVGIMSCHHVDHATTLLSSCHVIMQCQPTHMTNDPTPRSCNPRSCHHVDGACVMLMVLINTVSCCNNKSWSVHGSRVT